MKVRIIKNVYIRHGRPHRSAPAKGILHPGFEMEVEPTDGESIDGNNKWYMDKNGDFIWSGGARVEGEAQINEPPELIDWGKRIANIPEPWISTKGRKIKIAVLDSGIFLGHPDFTHINPASLIDKSDSDFGIEDRDEFSHGTHCAGLINARTMRNKGILGAASESELYVIKVKHEQTSHDERTVADGIAWARGLRVHIISMSFKIGNANDPRLNDQIDRAGREHIVMIAAAGDNNRLLRQKIDYPASHELCVAVGAINQEHFNNNANATYDKKLDYIMPFQKMWSCVRKEQGYYDQHEGSSMCTALMSGIVALLLSHLNFHEFRDPDYLKIVKEELDKCTVPLNENLDIDNKTLHIIKPNYSQAIIA